MTRADWAAITVRVLGLYLMVAAITAIAYTIVGAIARVAHNRADPLYATADTQQVILANIATNGFQIVSLLLGVYLVFVDRWLIRIVGRAPSQHPPESRADAK